MHVRLPFDVWACRRLEHATWSLLHPFIFLKFNGWIAVVIPISDIIPDSKFSHELGRFSNAGESVLGIGTESTALPEAALKQGRGLELYLLDTSAKTH